MSRQNPVIGDVYPQREESPRSRKRSLLKKLTPQISQPPQPLPMKKTSYKFILTRKLPKHPNYPKSNLKNSQLHLKPHPNLSLPRRRAKPLSSQSMQFRVKPV